MAKGPGEGRKGIRKHAKETDESEKTQDPETEKQFKEEQIAAKLYDRKAKSQLPKPKQEHVNLDNKDVTLGSRINDETMVLPAHVRDPGSQLYRRMLYTWGMTPKMVKMLWRLRNFTEADIDDHINWFAETFECAVTQRSSDLDYKKQTFGHQLAAIHYHKMLMEAKEEKVGNRVKYIQNWVNEKIKYPMTIGDFGNRKFLQTVAQEGFTKETVKELTDRGFTPGMVTDHVKKMKNYLGFRIPQQTVRARTLKYSPPSKLPEEVFIQIRERVPLTTMSATPAQQTTPIQVPLTAMPTASTEMEERNVGTVTEKIEPNILAEDPEDRGGLPIITNVISLHT